MANKIGHCLVLTYPSCGHINPMIQFSKRLEHKGLKVTLVLTKFIHKTFHVSDTSISVETISDGHDEGGIASAESIQAYLDRFRVVGSETLAKLVQSLSGSGLDPVKCIVYDAFLPWGLDVAKAFGMAGAVFFTQSCAVDQVYYHVNKGLLGVSVSVSGPGPVVFPGLVPLERSDLPSFVSDPDKYPPVVRLVVDQFSNVEGADWVLCNTFLELEEEVVNWMRKIIPLRTVGPTVPSMFLDKRIEGDKQYGMSLSNPNSEVCMKWLNSRPNRSVVYVSFGSLVDVEAEQVNEVACGLRKSDCPFLWVVRSSEKEKLPKGFVEESSSSEKGLVVSWCNQLEVLANDKIGCFVTHCGWNSTLEAISLGVPMVAIPQWSDQFTNAKYIADVWKVGIRAKRDEKGIVRGQVLEKFIKETMEGERGREIRNNAIKWSESAKKAMDKCGSSDKNIDEFITSFHR